MFKIGNRDDYEWPVTVHPPKDGGEFAEHAFKARFKRVDEPGVRDLSERSVTGKLDDMAFCREVLTGFSEIQGADGNALAFSKENLDLVLAEQGLPRAIVRAFFESIRGGKEKN